MNDLDEAWMADPTVRDLMRRFPVALAMIGDDSEVELLNEQFLRGFDPSCLRSEALHEIVAHPGRPWSPVNLMRLDGTAIETQARAVHVHNSTLLVIDETPGSLSANALEDLRHRIAELERTSSTDRLTGAWNRAHLDRVVESELSRSARLRQPVSLILIDIDHFKRVNDTHGHQAGDQVLVELVQVATSVLRTADVLFRWGGEEFVVLAPATGYRAAGTVAERLRGAVAEHTFATVGSLTISLGVAEHAGQESAADWFRRVDEALYSAKHGGRNRAVIDERGSSDEWAAEAGGSALRLVWLEAYECGDATIDGEHRELFELANALVAASLSSGSKSSEFDAALSRLLDHIVRHFSDEEALLAERGYRHLASHKHAHARLLQRAGELRDKVRSGEVTLGGLVEFLAADVVAQHLLKVDKDFFPLFRKR